MEEIYCQMLRQSIDEMISQNDELKSLMKKAVSQKMIKEEVCMKMVKNGEFETYEEAREFFYNNEDWIYINKYSVFLDEILEKLPTLVKNYIDSKIIRYE